MSRSIPDTEPSILADLAAASRILAKRGVVDAFGHVSLRHPVDSNLYLMPSAQAPALTTPGDIITYTLNSDALNSGTRSNFIERFIHGEIYKMRPDVNSIVHSHSASVIPFGIIKKPMVGTFHNAAFLANGAPIFDIREKFGQTDMLVCDCAKGIALAETLEDKHVALMRAHGSVACGKNLQLSVFRAVYTEVSARIQTATVMLAGSDSIEPLDQEEGRLADAVNDTACKRAWRLWRNEILMEVGW
ncbi:MAG: aldolase [Rhodospirillaceae bacterium]|nr:aldolase [Rhodospirillaceae bacterium]|tara:strand:+ start:2218 stop:2955 length:738 start_codon:yes stop_codon:yes gene_type:complete